MNYKLQNQKLFKDLQTLILKTVKKKSILSKNLLLLTKFKIRIQRLEYQNTNFQEALQNSL